MAEDETVSSPLAQMVQQQNFRLAYRRHSEPAAQAVLTRRADAEMVWSADRGPSHAIDERVGLAQRFTTVCFAGASAP
jgi:hypothetical protein